jgi:hypothetical protein
MQWLVPILCAVFSGTGLWALLSARATARATREAAALSAAPAQAQAATADWSALMSYWQSEMAAVRDTASKLDVRIQFLEQEREDDQKYIADLEIHIWSQLPPPPPVRQRLQKNNDEAP